MTYSQAIAALAGFLAATVAAVALVRRWFALAGLGWLAATWSRR